MNTQNIRYHAHLKISVNLPSLIFKASLLSFHNILTQTHPLIALDTIIFILLQLCLVNMQHCHDDPIQSHRASWIFPLGGKTWSPPKSDSPCNSFTWPINSFFTTKICSCKLIPCLQNCVWFPFGLLKSLNASNTSIPHTHDHAWPSVPQHWQPIHHC